MLYQLGDRLFRRELDAGRSTYGNLKSIYGDKHWVDNLDIVNELGGHHGCVNALRLVRAVAMAFERMPC
jgi:nuclear receptor interaction protein